MEYAELGDSHGKFMNGWITDPESEKKEQIQWVTPPGGGEQQAVGLGS